MSIGERIRSERERLDYTQPEFAALAGSAKRSQVGWEQNRTLPNAAALAAWQGAGADVVYILTGRYSGEIDTGMFSLCDSALRKAYRELRPDASTSVAFRHVHICNLYNEMLRNRRPDSSRLEGIGETARRYIENLRDPSDPGQLERVLLPAPDVVDAQVTGDLRGHADAGTTVIATRGSAASGGNQTIGAPPRRKR